MTTFGDHVWLITDGAKFNDRVRAACAARHLRLRHGFVRYVDTGAAHGSVPNKFLGFVKDIKHKSEREYRLLFSSNEPLPDPFILDVGSLEDASMVVPFREFIDGWSIGPPDE